MFPRGADFCDPVGVHDGGAVGPHAYVEGLVARFVDRFGSVEIPEESFESRTVQGFFLGRDPGFQLEGWFLESLLGP